MAGSATGLKITSIGRLGGNGTGVRRCRFGNARAAITSICIGSVDELSKLTGRDLSDLDLHRPYVDDIRFPCPECGGTMQRVS